MKISKWQDFNDNLDIRFRDNSGMPCRIASEQDNLLRFSVYGLAPNYIFFSQEDIKALLPYLQSFAETGRLELPPQDTPLQGGTLADAFKPENLIRASAEQNCKIYEQEKRIKELERLLKRWKDAAETGSHDGECVCPNCCPVLHADTAIALGKAYDPAS
jgi:hypothetical protein